MTTKAPAEVNYFDADSQIKKLYAAIDELKETITVDNDRNRLSFCLNLYFQKEIESVYEAIVQAKPTSSKVDFKELERLVVNKLKEKGIN
jgi:predicted transcriptional regulator YheO